MHTLLVEGNGTHRDTLSDRSSRHGRTVVIAIGDHEAPERPTCAESRQLPMGLSLPVIDGWDVARLSKAEIRTCNIPVSASTARAIANDGERAAAAGHEDFDTRSLDPDRLLGTVEAWLVVTGASGSPP